MIPALLHQTAPTTELPRPLRAYVRTIRALHPGWTYKLWTDADNLALVEADFPSELGLYTSLPHPIMRSDLARYLILARHGGFYMDTDYEMFRAFDLVNEDLVLPWETDDGLRPGMDKIANAVMASAPGHPFWKLVLAELHASPPGPGDDPVDATGPGLMTRLYRRASAEGMRICTPERHLFCPRVPRNMRQYRAIVARGGYGIHHCRGTWRNFSLRQRARNALGRLAHRILMTPPKD